MSIATSEHWTDAMLHLLWKLSTKVWALHPFTCLKIICGLSFGSTIRNDGHTTCPHHLSSMRNESSMNKASLHFLLPVIVLFFNLDSIHWVRILDKPLEILWHHIWPIGWLHPVHEIPYPSFEPRISVFPCPAIWSGKQVLVLAYIHVFVGRQVHHRQLGMIPTHSHNRDGSQAKLHPKGQGHPRHGMVHGKTSNVHNQGDDETNNTQGHEHEEPVEVFVVVQSDCIDDKRTIMVKEKNTLSCNTAMFWPKRPSDVTSMAKFLWR